jgi:hypothetical protein
LDNYFVAVFTMARMSLLLLAAVLVTMAGAARGKLKSRMISL